MGSDSHTQGASLPSEASLETPSYTPQDVCLLGDSNPVKLTMKTNYHKAGGEYLE